MLVLMHNRLHITSASAWKNKTWSTLNKPYGPHPETDWNEKLRINELVDVLQNGEAWRKLVEAYVNYKHMTRQIEYETEKNC